MSESEVPEDFQVPPGPDPFEDIHEPVSQSRVVFE